MKKRRPSTLVIILAMAFGCIVGAFWHSYTNPLPDPVQVVKTNNVYVPRTDIKYIDRVQTVEDRPVSPECQQALDAAEDLDRAITMLSDTKGTLQDMLSESKMFVFEGQQGMDQLTDMKTRYSQLATTEVEAWQVAGSAQSDWFSYKAACTPS